MIDLGKAFGVYQIKNLITGERYIGSTTVTFRHRWGTHQAKFGRGKGNRRLRNAWNRYGAKYWIDTLAPEYNIVPIAGSTLGYRHSDEERSRISERQRGRKLSDEHKKKISSGLVGIRRKDFSDEHRAKLRAARIRQGSPQPAGYKHSDETRDKLRKSHLGKKHSEETRANQSAAIKRWWSERRQGSSV